MSTTYVDEEVIPARSLHEVTKWRQKLIDLFVEKYVGEELVGDRCRRDVGRELAPIDVFAADMAFFDQDRFDLTAANGFRELAVRDVRRCRLVLLERRKEQKHHDKDHDPEGQVFIKLLVHTVLRSPNRRLLVGALLIE